ncbi:MAG: peptide chain release factor N(5)-glutamine methyltransferase [Chloroflexota bacterium]|nr:peptide chain release factor N(5)-glutamine methyltransferase [Chloroflexota bacterium]
MGGTSARLEAQLLLGHATGRARADLLAHPELGVSEAEESAFHELLARREADEPIAYVLGEREFYGRMFSVDRRALIPRPETELLVDLGKAAVARWRAAGVEPNVVDVGTGCGAIAISVAAEAGIHVVATDVSGAALTLAHENAARQALSTALSFVQTDLAAGFRGPLHVVLANLPYVPRGRDLPRDVKDYEPPLAIFGGVRGTELIERFLRDVRPLLPPGAEVCVELDEEEQATPVAALARTLYPDADVSMRQDAGGYDRVVQVRLEL